MTQTNVSRRKALAGIGASGIVLAQYATRALAQETPMPTDIELTRYPTIQSLKSEAKLKENTWIETIGFHIPGDGGGAVYQIQDATKSTQPNDADIIALNDDRVAVLHETQAINYKMFGAVGDGQQDDGIRIKQAHQYANEHRVPIVNLTGEYWIKETNSILIKTNVSWGQTVFHIDEKHNSRRHPRFEIQNDGPNIDLTSNEKIKTALLDKLKPGVQIIPELAPYAGHLITAEDAEDRIGIRAGNYSKRGWAREELFYVEEEGRVIGDIAWEFKNFTEITAIPCNDNYLIVEGGGFYFSGDSAVGSDQRGYRHHGIVVRRSRTIIREQWMGLEKGVRDISMHPRRGFYNFSGVYDVTLENVRAMPWEKNRREEGGTIYAGTYGIGGARMLNCTFRNITADAGWVAWGVFGTNLNKNFRIEDCRLNRIDVHFHCWNLYINNCEIGFKGISVTGGGDLVIENTTRHGNSFVNFRRDYGAKWDGHIRLRGCTLRPTNGRRVVVLSYRPSNFDYQYPIGFGRSIKIEDLLIDYSAAPESKSSCWLMDTVPFSKTEENARLFFPHSMAFRNILVEGRELGVRLIRIPNPQHYTLHRDGGYDDVQLAANAELICDNVQLEQFTQEIADDDEQVHLLIGSDETMAYADQQALYPKIRFTDCDGVSVYMSNVIASAIFERCTLNTIAAPNLKGELTFDTCRFQPNVAQLPEAFYIVKSTLGTRFTNCTIHAPIINGQRDPEQIDRTGFLEINKSVHHHHLNTALGNDVLNHLKNKGTALDPDFIVKLRAHHELDAE